MPADAITFPNGPRLRQLRVMSDQPTAPDTAARWWRRFWHRHAKVAQEQPFVEPPPICCGEAMVHNSFTGMYECADAYFWLDSERLLGDCGDLIDWRRHLTEFDRERYDHWKASWVPDGWEAMVR